MFAKLKNEEGEQIREVERASVVVRALGHIRGQALCQGERGGGTRMRQHGGGRLISG